MGMELGIHKTKKEVNIEIFNILRLRHPNINIHTIHEYIRNNPDVENLENIFFIEFQEGVNFHIKQQQISQRNSSYQKKSDVL